MSEAAKAGKDNKDLPQGSQRIPQHTRDTLLKLTTLYQAGIAINQAATEEEVVQALTKQLAYGEFDRGLVILFREKEEPCGEMCGYWDRSPDSPPPATWTPSRYYEPTIQLVNDVPNSTALDPLIQAEWAPTDVQAVALIPMKAHGDMIGALVLQARSDHQFTMESVEPYQALASQATTVIQNQRLLSAEKQRAEELMGLVALSETFESIADLSQTYEALTQRMAQALGVQQCLIALFEPLSRQVVGQSPAYGIPDSVAREFRYTVSQELSQQWHLRQRGVFITNTPQQDIADELAHFVTAFGVESLLVAPMLAEDKTLGLIFAANKPGGFSQRDAQLVTIFASQAAVVIRGSQLLERVETEASRAQKQADQFSSLLHSYQKVQASPDLVTQIQTIAEGVEEAGLFHRAVLSVFDDEWRVIQEISGYAGLTDEEVAFLKSTPPPTREERLLHFQDQFQISDSYFIPAGQNPLRERAVASHRSSDQLGEWDPEDMLSIPLRMGDKVVGVLNVDDPFDGRRPTEESLVPLELFASLAARVIENNRLFSNTQMLYQISGSLAEAQTLTAISQVIVDQFRELVGAERADAFIIDPPKNRLTATAESGPDLGQEPISDFHQMGEGLLGETMRTNRPILWPDGDDPPEPDQDRQRLAELGIGSTILLPLASGDQVLGVIRLMNRQDRRIFTQLDVDLLTAVTGQAAIALANMHLLNEAEYRAGQLQTTAAVSRATSSVLDLETLFSETIELIRERFNLYYVGLFLVDEAMRWAVLQAGTGKAGQEQVAAAHRLEVGGESMIGQSVIDQRARIALDVGEEAVHFANPYLPDTRSEIALPLVARGQVIGALTIQSVEEAAFGDEDINILQTMADQLAVAISNARLFDQLQVSLEESKELQRRYIRQEWDVQALARSSEDRGGYEYDLVDIRPSAQTMTLEMAESAATTSGVLSSQLRLGDEIIGTIGVEADRPGYQWTEDEIAIINAVGEQVALAMETAFHSEQSEQRSLQMAAAAQVGQTVASAMTAESLNQQAVELISKLFGYYHVAIFTPDEQGGFAVLQEATGRAGEIMKASNYRLALTDPTPVSRSLIEQQPCIAMDVEPDSWFQNPLLPETRSEMALPLAAGGKLFGILSVHSIQPAAFDQVDVTVLQTVADQIAVGLQNAELFEETRQGAAEQQMLFDVTTAAVTTSDLDQMLTRVAQIIFDSMRSSDVAIMLVDEDRRTLRMRAAAGFASLQDSPIELQLGEGVTGWVALTGEPIILGDVTASVQYITGDPKSRSELALPISVDEEVVGVINVESPDLNAFDESDLRLLQTLSGTLGAILKNIRLVDELQAANIRLEEVDRLKSQFLANMSHELRTPLNSIIGFSRVILKGIDGPITPLQEQDLGSIYNSGQHLLQLINNVLDVSKIEAGKMELAPEQTQVMDIIQSVMSTAIGLVKDKPVELHQEVQPDLPPVWADPFRLRQVLLNLISNAAKFTEKGSITLQAAYDPQAVFVQVIDTGIGIGDEDKSKLFQAFSQVDASSTRRVGGTGLGLAISASLMEIQGGRIWVESEMEKGSTFSIAIPRVNESGDGPVPILMEPPTVEAPKPILVEERILAIDNERGVIDVYQRYLEDEGIEVVGCTEGQEGLERAIALSNELGAITIDVDLADVDGWEIVRQLREGPATRDLPIIICSLQQDKSRAEALGVAGYLIKPIIKQDLVDALSQSRSKQNE